MESKRQGRTDGPKDINEVRVGMKSRVRNVIRYCNHILTENKVRELRFSAVGGAIGKLVDAVEVLKIVNPGLYQVNKVTTVSYKTVDGQERVVSERLFPKLDVVLTLDEPKERTEGFQAKLDEEERVKLFNLLNSRPQRPTRGRGGPRGGRGGPRGGRGGPRGRGFRGGRGSPRGGPRGGRPRGVPRGGPRGAPRGAPRGGFRGAPRGGFRGGRGGPRPRGNQ